MSRKPALSNVPKISSLTYAELSKDQFSTNWFAIYDEMSPEKQAEYNRYLLAKLKKKEQGWTYQGVITTFIPGKRKQAESAQKVKESLDKLAPPPTKDPVAPRATAPFVVPPDVHAQCQQLKKEIEEFIGYTTDLEKFPEVNTKYRPKFLEELQNLQDRLSNDCFLRGQVPERQKFFKKMTSLLESMMTEMMADPRYAPGARKGGKRRTRKQKRKAKGNTRKYHRKKHRKRKTRKSTN